MGNQDDSPARQPLVVKPLDSMVRILCDFTDIITIRVKEKYFKVPRDLLTATSIFFDEELSYTDPKRFFLTIDDIDAELFNKYINVLFESAFSPGFRIRNHKASTIGGWADDIELLLRLWQLSKRFNSFRMCLITEEALTTQYFRKLTAQRWKKVYVKYTEGHIRQILLALQKCYTLCEDESIPFATNFVAACAECPGQMVATYLDHLDPGFRAEVVKSFAIRLADPEVAQRKRVREDEGEPRACKRRRC